MTLSHSSPSLRSFTLAAIAGLMTLTSFAATVSPAAAGDRIYYRAQLAAPVEKTKEVIGGVLWVCEGTACIAGRGGSRPVVMCTRLAREVGDVTGFSYGEKTLEETKIERCNKD